MGARSKVIKRRVESSKISLKPTYLEAFLILGFNLIFIGVPYSIQLWQGYDDALFIRHAISIRNGEWLGDFNELTLVKGPGYPVFLALNNFFGLNVVLTQALFYSLSIFFVFKVFLLSKVQRFLSPFIFGFVLLDPRVFLLDHPIRETIYTSQAIMAICLLIYGLHRKTLSLSESIKNLALTMFGGIIFGWFWITREEGLWLVPSLFLILLYFGNAARKEANIKKFLLPVFSYLLGFLIVLSGYFALNLHYYGSFSGVDITEGNFTSAIQSLESIDIGSEKPFVSVTKEMRKTAYEVSPTFSLLQDSLDPQGSTSQWENVMCWVHKTTCGEIPNGFFVFAIRQAAAKVGAYETPKSASSFFKKITTEVRHACSIDLVKCKSRTNVLPHLPPMSKNQIEFIPSRSKVALDSIISSGYVPVTSRGEISGDPNEFESTLSFLGRPSHFKLNSGSKLPTSVLVQTSHEIRILLVFIYDILIPIFILIGLICGIAFVRKFRSRNHYEKVLFLLGTCFILGATIRSALIVLIDVSSFPAIHDGYLNASYSFTLIGFSIWILVQIRLILEQPNYNSQIYSRLKSVKAKLGSK